MPDFDDLAKKAGEALGNAKDAIGQAVEKAAPVVEDAVNKAKDAGAAAVQAAKPVVEDALNKAQAAGAAAVEKAKPVVADAVNTVKNKAEELTNTDLDHDGKIGDQPTADE